VCVCVCACVCVCSLQKERKRKVENRVWRVRVNIFLKVKATQGPFFNIINDVTDLIKSDFALVTLTEC
jgi:hypothetical protein